MADDDGPRAYRLWALTAFDEFCRFRSRRRSPGSRFRPPPMPPAAVAERDRVLGVWPLSQHQRDNSVSLVVSEMTGLVGTFARRHGVIPEPEARRAAAAVEAEAFAAASAYAAGKDLAIGTERYYVFREYGRELCISANRYAASRPQAAAAGTSRAGPAALPPPPTAATRRSRRLMARARAHAGAGAGAATPEE